MKKLETKSQLGQVTGGDWDVFVSDSGVWYHTRPLEDGAVQIFVRTFPDGRSFFQRGYYDEATGDIVLTLDVRPNIFGNVQEAMVEVLKKLTS